MIELTRQQRQAVAEGDNPILVDPETNTAYVLVRKELFDRLKTLLTLDEYDADEGLIHMNEVMADDDAGDPLLQSYQHERASNP